MIDFTFEELKTLEVTERFDSETGLQIYPTRFPKGTSSFRLHSLQDEIEREKENSTLARFMRNLESRVYAELSRQLVNNLFGETPSSSGTITLEGNTIEYTSDGVTLTLKITEADGTITEITIPIGTFTF